MAATNHILLGTGSDRWITSDGDLVVWTRSLLYVGVQTTVDSTGLTSNYIPPPTTQLEVDATVVPASGTIIVTPTQYDIGPPVILPPTNIIVTPGLLSNTITWDPAVGATYYNLYRSITIGAETLLAASVTSPYLDSGLSSGVEYFYKVSAETALSDEASGTPL